ncbi:interferon regulatory factor 3 [Chanos chanos]|uniref:Interferon regulatory factor 3 n=1 Tax=Chanos chanos TaxID=29144 RepID=A0A6J2VCA7_CHACN|nr:interferon regulatory factor 3-like [Chanos chanos]
MAHSKPLLIPWLRQQIDSGRFPGVAWTNEGRTQFCIPWKHALRQDSSSDDVLIFKAWAETSSGGQSEGGKTPGDPSVWKRNFRSALRAKGFILLHDNKNDAANPHKVFQWPEEGQSGGSQESDAPFAVVEDLYRGEDEFWPGENSSDLLEQCLEGLNIGPTQTQPGIGSPFSSDSQQYYMDGASASGGQSPLNGIGGQYGQCPIVETLGIGPFSPAEGATGTGQFSPAEGAYAEACYTTEQAVPVCSVQDNHPEWGTHFRVLIYYKGKKVLEQLVENETGFRLVYRESCSTMGPFLPLVELPSTDSILDQTQAELTRSILDNLGGVEVRVEGPWVYAHRWGDSRVYWSLSKHDQSGVPKALSKTVPEPIYSARDYVTGLREFMSISGGQSPPFSVFFCLGEKWPDPKFKPWEKKLIFVEVVFTALEKLKQMAVEGGASSLQSVELQLSLDQIMEM